MESKQGNKVFVGGLSLATTDEGLREHFQQYGEIEDAVVMRDKEPSNKSRGFGFVTFVSVESMRECLNSPNCIDFKEVEVKKAIPKEDCRPGSSNPMPNPTPSKKVFLGGLPLEATKEEIMATLQSCGPLIDVQIMTDKHTNKPRGFGFAIFEDFSSAQNLCDKKYIKILDRDVEVKMALSQDEMRRVDANQGAPRGGGGGGGNGSDYGYGRGDAYGRSGGYYKGMSPYGYGGDYGRMPGYDYGRYDYMRGADYMASGWGSYYDTRGQGNSQAAYYKYPTGYDMSTYSAMYPPSGQGMGTYSSQSASNYGPSRGGYAGGGGGDKDKDRAAGRGYHPYRR